ncbi:hypothetical protein H6G51_08315 [Limnothrix sp. FACHB-708]|uniref:hypothetical protein n=1 Tax=unclassified Limnothrix TaxID=2632864 RepID=UPI0016828098|nr:MULTISPECIES: hypothetical protein [unclassified Limnothrix]MBD2553280.1 hypothetical protein [Limnothrix sp. FACHB-708]MBD2590696.1 hypothetical protein [Limnothrix sp. FACHB-406]
MVFLALPHRAQRRLIPPIQGFLVTVMAGFDPSKVRFFAPSHPRQPIKKRSAMADR